MHACVCVCVCVEVIEVPQLEAVKSKASCAAVFATHLIVSPGTNQAEKAPRNQQETVPKVNLKDSAR